MGSTAQQLGAPSWLRFPDPLLLSDVTPEKAFGPRQPLLRGTYTRETLARTSRVVKDELCRPLGTEPKTGGKGSKSIGCDCDYSRQDPEGQAERVQAKVLGHALRAIGNRNAQTQNPRNFLLPSLRTPGLACRSQLCPHLRCCTVPVSLIPALQLSLRPLNSRLCSPCQPHSRLFPSGGLLWTSGLSLERPPRGQEPRCPSPTEPTGAKAAGAGRGVQGWTDLGRMPAECSSHQGTLPASSTPPPASLLCPRRPAQPCRPRTDDGEVGAGSDARDHVGGDTFPLPVVLLTQGTELQAPTGQGTVLASAGLPYLGEQGAGKRVGTEMGVRREARSRWGGRA